MKKKNSGIPLGKSLPDSPLADGEVLEAATVDETFESEAKEVRGDLPPTTNGSLPYTGSGGALSSSTFSNIKFKPYNNGTTITIKLTGTISSGTATIKVELYASGNEFPIYTYSYGNGSGWTNVRPDPNPFVALNPNTYYYYKIVKSSSSPSGNTLSYTLNVT